MFVNGMLAHQVLKNTIFWSWKTLEFCLNRSWKVLEISCSVSVRTLWFALLQVCHRLIESAGEVFGAGCLQLFTPQEETVTGKLNVTDDEEDGSVHSDNHGMLPVLRRPSWGAECCDGRVCLPVCSSVRPTFNHFACHFAKYSPILKILSPASRTISLQ